MALSTSLHVKLISLESATKCAAALLMLGAQIAAGMPTPASTDFPAVELAQRSKTYQGDDPNLSGARIAGDDEVPPVGARDLSMLERSLAPTATYSTDHKYTVKHSCDTDQSIPKIFLYASESIIGTIPRMDKTDLEQAISRPTPRLFATILLPFSVLR